MLVGGGMRHAKSAQVHLHQIIERDLRLLFVQ